MIISNAQSLKTYNGPFKVGFGLEGIGKANYTYYDDPKTFERTKQGIFIYTLSLKNDIGGTFVRKATGHYNHGNKTGIWQFNINYVDYGKPAGDNLINATGYVTLTAPYLDGLPNGVWIYKKRILVRDKHYYFGRLITTPYKLYEETTLSVSFKQGILCGPINEKTDEYSVSGDFSSNGNLNGQWIVKSNQNEETTQYKDGLVMSRINRSLPNGEILEKELDNQDLKQKYLSGKINEKDIEALDCKFEKRNIFTDKFIDFTETIFNDADFMYTTLQGDTFITLSQDDILKYSINNIGGNFIKITPIKFNDLQDDYNFKTAEEAFNKSDFVTAQRFYNTILQNQDVFPLKRSDQKYINDKLASIRVIQTHGNPIEKASTKELNSLFLAILTSANADSASNFLLQNVTYKIAYGGQIGPTTWSIGYLPMCCFNNYIIDPDHEFQAFKLQVDYQNNTPKTIHFMLGDNTNNRIALSNNYIDGLIQLGFHIAFEGYQAVNGSGFKTKAEYNAIDGLEKLDTYVTSVILTNGILNYNFYNQQLILISKAKN